MHSAPAGSSFVDRVAGFVARVRFRAARPLAVIGMVVLVFRRLRVLPVALGALVLGAFALAAPLAPSHDDGADSSAALSSTAGDGEELLPATGDGWTQDGAPAAPSTKDEASAASSSSASAASPAAVAVTEDPAPTSDTASSPAPSSADTPSSSAVDTPSSDAPSPSATVVSETPAAPSPTEPAVATTALAPADEALSAVNDARTAAGCDALAPDAGLASEATEHSTAMRDDEEVDVPSSDGEAWAVATGRDPSAVADDWLGEDSLLDCGLTTAGVGAVGGYWTLVAA